MPTNKQEKDTKANKKWIKDMLNMSHLQTWKNMSKFPRNREIHIRHTFVHLLKQF
jgi:hypothetical protein